MLERRNIGIICLLWFISFLLCSFYLSRVISRQDRKFKISGYLLDFTQKSRLKVGSIPKKYNQVFRTNSSDIWLPTGLIPQCIGEFRYRNDLIELHLNDFVQNRNTTSLIEKVGYPKIQNKSQEKDFDMPKQIISNTVLREGIVINYSVEGHMKIRIEPTRDPAKFYLFFEPQPSHLIFKLYYYNEMQNDRVELLFNNALPSQEFDGDIQLIRLSSPEINFNGSLFQNRPVYLSRS